MYNQISSAKGFMNEKSCRRRCKTECCHCHIAHHLGGWILGGLEQDGDAQVHEGLGKVDHRLSGIIDGHGADGQVGSFVDQLSDDPVPLTRFMVEEADHDKSREEKQTSEMMSNLHDLPVEVVRNGVELELEAHHVRDGLQQQQDTAVNSLSIYGNP